MTKAPTTCRAFKNGADRDAALDSDCGWPDGARNVAGRLSVRASPGTIGATDRVAHGRESDLESVRAWLAEHAPDLPLIEVEGTTATVDTAAEALGVEPGRIAKTLAVRAGEQTFLLVARGNAQAR